MAGSEIPIPGPAVLFEQEIMIDNIIGNQKTIQHLPIDSISHYGTNPFGGSIYRVVWSDSRLAISGGAHKVYEGKPSNDATLVIRGKDPNLLRTEVGYKYVPLYPAAKNSQRFPCWVLEKWKSGISFTGMTESMWNVMYTDPETGLLELGPYPSRGEYESCYLFPKLQHPGYLKVCEVISWVEAGGNYTLAEHRQAILSEHAKREKDWERKNVDAQRDARRIGRGAPINLTPGKRTEPNFKHSADELGLVRKPGPFVGG
jgi:hypothetical protein